MAHGLVRRLIGISRRTRSSLAAARKRILYCDAHLPV
jgi:hypothetical protein